MQIGNHTFTHADLRKLTSAQITAELERNDAWITKTFGITSRPWWRPPYGFHNPGIDAVAAAAGYTHVAMWNGSLGDSQLLTPEVLLAQADKYVRPGTLLLGHANHPTITHLYDKLVELIRARALTPKTLDQVFGTSRANGSRPAQWSSTGGHSIGETPRSRPGLGSRHPGPWSSGSTGGGSGGRCWR